MAIVIYCIVGILLGEALAFLLKKCYYMCTRTSTPVAVQTPAALQAQWATDTPPDLPARALALVHETDGWDASGEAKRHRVYAQLLKEFPALSKRQVSLAIELALADLSTK